MITPYSNIISVTTEKFPFEFTINTANTSTGSTAADQFKLPLVSSLPLNAVVNWGDGSSDTITVFNQAETTHTYASAGSYTVSITGDLSGWAFANGGDKLKILNVASWESLIINESSIFRGCTNLTSNALDAPNNITTLFEAFRDCPNFNGNISSWDVSQVSSFQSCFFGASSFNQNIGGWNVSNATTMTSMFRSFVGHAFNQNLGSWDVSNVQFMDNMFSGSNSFNNGGLDLIKNWDVSNVQYMNNMFELATAFNQDIGSWDVSNVSFFSNFMDGKTAADYSAANLDSIYNNWSLLTLSPNLSISFGSINYTAAGQEGKNILTNSPNNWVIVDGSQSPALLLDTYSGAAAAYSLRLLRSDYTGKAIRVRRASDNTEQDIGFVGEDLNTSALTTFCSGTDGFVKTWYDQSGNARDATQSTAAQQPQIVSSGSVIVNLNNLPTLEFDGINDNLRYTTVTLNQPLTLFLINKYINTSGFKYTVDLGGDRTLGFPNAASTNGMYFGAGLNSTVSPNINNPQLWYALANGLNSELSINNETLIIGNAGTRGTTNITIGSYATGGAFFVNSFISEFIFYASDQSTNRTGIETNINAQYQIYWDGSQTSLLDSYGGSAAAYSLRALSSAYVGPLVRVRRASDNAEQDIYANYDGTLNTSSLESFCSGTNGFVTEWYDQSGNGNNATQTTAANQPQIVSSGSVILENGKPSVEFDGNGNMPNGVGTSTPTNVSAFAVRGISSYPSTFRTLFNYKVFGLTYNSNGGAQYGNGAHIFKTSSAVAKSDDYPTTTGQAVDTIINNTNLERNAFAATLSNGSTYSNGISAIGSWQNTSQSFVGTIQELVIYESDESSNKSGIQTNINDFYSIY